VVKNGSNRVHLIFGHTRPNVAHRQHGADRPVPDLLKRFATNLNHWFVEKRSESIVGVGVSKTTWLTVDLETL